MHVHPLTGYTPVCGIEEVSASRPNSRCTMQSSCHPCYSLCNSLAIVYSCHAQQLISFHIRYLRKLFYIKWQVRTPDIWSPSESRHNKYICNAQEITAKVGRLHMLYVWRVPAKKVVLQWAENRKMFLWMPKEALQRQSEGLPEVLSISPYTWEEAAQACITWHGMINTRTTAYEEHRVDGSILKCQQQKGRARNTSMSYLLHALPCLPCNAVFAAQIGTNYSSLHPHYCLPLILSHGHLWHWRTNTQYV